MGFMQNMRELLFPPRCIFCRRVLAGGSRPWCDSCREKLSGQESVTEGMFVSPIWAALRYEGAVREAIIRYKFRRKKGYVREFGKILAECVNMRLAERYDLITWIPVSAQREKQRGYDQAMLLCSAAALELGDVAVATLEKTVDNPAQSGLKSRAERKSNVLGAYRVTDAELVTGKRILLMDDIVTTGATMEEAARTLLGAGAKTVVGAALARPSEHTKD